MQLYGNGKVWWQQKEEESTVGLFEIWKPVFSSAELSKDDLKTVLHNVNFFISFWSAVSFL